MRNIKRNANSGVKGVILGLIFLKYFINYGENHVAKTTFDRKIRNDGGTEKKLLLTCVQYLFFFSLFFSEISIKKMPLPFCIAPA
jgi:hypothetical protein